MEVEIRLKKQVEKYMNKCDLKTYTKIKNALEKLKKLDGDIKRMEGSSLYRLKIPPYRILFSQEYGYNDDNEEIMILTAHRIGPRGDVYKKKGV